MYMELGRIIRLTDGQRYAIVRVTWLTKIFVLGDIVAFLVQMLGAGMLASGSGNTASTGKTIIIIGLVIQIIFFVLFVVTSSMFHVCISREPTEKIQKHSLPWKKHLINIYVCSVMVLIRCVFRLIEYSMVEDAYLMTNEWVIYVFDAILMAVVMAAFAILHPSEIRALLNGTGIVMTKIVFTKPVSLHVSEDQGSQTYQLV